MQSKKIGYLFILAITLVGVFPLLLTFPSPGFLPAFDGSTGAVGDTIGGITAPVVGLFSAYLVYQAFIVQVKANEELRKDREQGNIFELFRMIGEEIDGLEREGDQKKGEELINEIKLKYREFYNRWDLYDDASERANIRDSIINSVSSISVDGLGRILLFTTEVVLDSKDIFFIKLFAHRYEEIMGILYLVKKDEKKRKYTLWGQFTEIYERFFEYMNKVKSNT